MKIPESPIMPNGDRLVILRLRPAEKKGMIIVPDEAKVKPQFGVVLACGESVKHIKRRFLVVFGKYAGSELSINDHELTILSESEVLGIICQGSLADSLLESGA